MSHFLEEERGAVPVTMLHVEALRRECIPPVSKTKAKPYLPIHGDIGSACIPMIAASSMPVFVPSSRLLPFVGCSTIHVPSHSSNPIWRLRKTLLSTSSALTPMFAKEIEAVGNVRRSSPTTAPYLSISPISSPYFSSHFLFYSRNLSFSPFLCEQLTTGRKRVWLAHHMLWVR